MAKELPFRYGALEAEGFNRHREKQRRTHVVLADPIEIASADDAAEEVAGFSRHREKQRMVYVFVPLELDDGSAPVGNVADIPVKTQLVAWQKAIIVIDASEIMVRDLIERELEGKTGQAAEYRPKRSLAAVDELVAKIADIRVGAIKTAFRLLRDRFNNAAVLETSLAQWASYFAQQDIKAIDAAIRAGLVNGEDNTEIARKVVGSMAHNGVDGVTEYTRNKIAHLGRAAIKAFNLRKAGEQARPYDPLTNIN